MRTYEKYKESCEIGEIPENWEAKRLKYLVDGKLMYGANESAEFDNIEDPRYIRITDFAEDGKLKSETFKSLPFDKAKDYLLNDGDILFARSGATVGKTFQFKDYTGLACFAGYLIKASVDTNQILSDWLYYFTKSGLYENWKNSIFNQATIQNIGADKYNSLLVPVPPLSEQTAIANYLDSKTTEIDQVIADKEALVSLYEEEKKALINEAVTKGVALSGVETIKIKLKPSNIDWLGDVPEHWEVKKLKYVAVNSPSNVDKKSNENEKQVLLCNYVDVYKNDFIASDLSFMEATASDAQIENFKLQKGDVLVTKDSETPEDIAIPALVKDDFENVICGYHLTLIRSNNEFLIGEFLFRLFQLDLYRQYFSTLARGVTRYGLTTSSFSEMPIILPPLEEQTAIVQYIESETANINDKSTKSNKK